MSSRLEIQHIDVERLLDKITRAAQTLHEQFDYTPLQHNAHWSRRFGASVYFKREDMNVVRSYKIRGAFNKMFNMEATPDKPVICASAGNHAQGVAYAAKMLNRRARIYMPQVTPMQKCRRVKYFGGDLVEIILRGDSFDESFQFAMNESVKHDYPFIHPFDDEEVIAGQASVAIELLDQLKDAPDYIFLPIGGGGLAAGISTCIKQRHPDVKIIGVEPTGAAAMKNSMEQGEHVVLDQIDTFVDGAAVKQVGVRNLELCRKFVDRVVTVDEGKICSTILSLYNEDAIVVEPAGALTTAVLEEFKGEIEGKKVVCIISGGNNDIMRMEEIKERSLLYEGLKRYFIVQFPQRAGALKEFLTTLGPNDDITHFEYTKKTNRETGAALVGIELKKTEDYDALLQRMNDLHIKYQPINDDAMLFDMLV